MSCAQSAAASTETAASASTRRRESDCRTRPAVLRRRNRFARHAIEDEQQTLLRLDRHGRNRAAIALDVDQRRRRSSGRSPSYRDAWSGKTTSACPSSRRARAATSRTDSSPADRRHRNRWRRAGRHIGNAARLIDRDESPGVRAGAIGPLIVLPRVMVRLAWSRNRVERPDQLARAQIPRAHVAPWSEARRLLRVIAGDRDILVDRRRGRQRDPKPSETSRRRPAADRPCRPARNPA